LTALLYGARQIECTINGIGERAGNASLEEIVMALRTRRDFFGLETTCVRGDLPGLAVLLTHHRRHVQPNKAVVGRTPSPTRPGSTRTEC